MGMVMRTTETNPINHSPINHNHCCNLGFNFLPTVKILLIHMFMARLTSENIIAIACISQDEG